VSIPFSYQTDEIDALERSLSVERLGGYVRSAQGDRGLAIRLYERNTRLSESLYGVVQGLEICLRNALHRVLSSAYGADWYGHMTMLSYPLPQKIAAAQDSIIRQGKLLTPGRVVAELSFGFWTALVGPKYEKRLWVPHLHKAFPNALRPVSADALPRKKPAMLDRSGIASRLEGVRQLRNRIAHHEPILHFKLDSQYRWILEATGWICRVTAAWIGATSSFQERYAAPLR
jgi:hypothetical protein